MFTYLKISEQIECETLMILCFSSLYIKSYLLEQSLNQEVFVREISRAVSISRGI